MCKNIYLGWPNEDDLDGWEREDELGYLKTENAVLKCKLENIREKFLRAEDCSEKSVNACAFLFFLASVQLVLVIYLISAS